MFSAANGNERKLDPATGALITEPRAWRLEDSKSLNPKKRVSLAGNPPAYQTSENQPSDLSLAEMSYAHH